MGIMFEWHFTRFSGTKVQYVSKSAANYRFIVILSIYIYMYIIKQPLSCCILYLAMYTKIRWHIIVNVVGLGKVYENNTVAFQQYTSV